MNIDIDINMDIDNTDPSIDIVDNIEFYPYLTCYEVARLIGVRAMYIENNSPIRIENYHHIHCSLTIAEEEFIRGKLNDEYIKRKISDKVVRIYQVKQLIIARQYYYKIIEDHRRQGIYNLKFTEPQPNNILMNQLDLYNEKTISFIEPIYSSYSRPLIKYKLTSFKTSKLDIVEMRISSFTSLAQIEIPKKTFDEHKLKVGSELEIYVTSKCSNDIPQFPNRSCISFKGVCVDSKTKNLNINNNNVEQYTETNSFGGLIANFIYVQQKPKSPNNNINNSVNNIYDDNDVVEEYEQKYTFRHLIIIHKST